MEITRQISAPGRDMIPDQEYLQRPFLIDPKTQHPFLTLAEYYNMLEHFVFSHMDVLLCLLKKKTGQKISTDQISRITITSEKHGAFLHISRLCVHLAARPERVLCCFALSTAIGESRGRLLAREFETIRTLSAKYDNSWLPEVYLTDSFQVENTNESKEVFTIMLSQWLDGFCEWHLDFYHGKSAQYVHIWDNENGDKFLTVEKAGELFRKIAMALTCYYDVLNYDQICLWHNAAGDFIVRTSDRPLDVKLTTVRDYRPLMDYRSEVLYHPFIPLLYFFLDLILRIRLDRINGTGEMIWGQPEIVRMAMKGFQDGMAALLQKGHYPIEQPEDFISLLKTFSREEVITIMNPLLGYYRSLNSTECDFIESHIKDHVDDVVTALNG